MKIAVTGTIGSGKSAVRQYLEEKGYFVFDCDGTNRELLNKKAYRLLHKQFPECFDEEKKLDKKRLSSIVFNNPEKREILESIMHPEILKAMNKRKDDPLFAEVPLLFEANWDIYFDESWLVVAEDKLIMERLLERGLSESEAKERIAVQMPVEEKMRRASQIIYNNGSLRDLHESIDKLLEKLC